jgi:hypothetical protein
MLVVIINYSSRPTLLVVTIGKMKFMEAIFRKFILNFRENTVHPHEKNRPVSTA